MEVPQMKSCQRYFSACLLALFASAAFGQEAPDTGDALGFAVLGATVTCTTSVIAGDVGISPATAFTNTGCTIAGGTPPATNAAAVGARADFLGTYADARALPCPSGNVLASTITGPTTLLPGVYCTGAALTGTGVLTLDAQGDPDAIWVFQIGAALSGTNFTVVMANGGQPCNVFWAPSADVTMTTSALKGNILAGVGSITLTGGSVAGSVLAAVVVTMTDTSVVGCDTLEPDQSPSCKPKKHHHKLKKGHDNDKGHGWGNPFGSNDKHDGKDDRRK
jgi:hypothetical protein